MIYMDKIIKRKEMKKRDARTFVAFLRGTIIRKQVFFVPIGTILGLWSQFLIISVHIRQKNDQIITTNEMEISLTFQRLKKKMVSLIRCIYSIF